VASLGGKGASGSQEDVRNVDKSEPVPLQESSDAKSLEKTFYSTNLK